MFWERHFLAWKAKVLPLHNARAVAQITPCPPKLKPEAKPLATL
jgi:hypothetical protein